MAPKSASDGRFSVGLTVCNPTWGADNAATTTMPVSIPAVDLMVKVVTAVGVVGKASLGVLVVLFVVLGAAEFSDEYPFLIAADGVPDNDPVATRGDGRGTAV